MHSRCTNWILDRRILLWCWDFRIAQARPALSCLSLNNGCKILSLDDVTDVTAAAVVIQLHRWVVTTSCLARVKSVRSPLELKLEPSGQSVVRKPTARVCPQRQSARERHSGRASRMLVQGSDSKLSKARHLSICASLKRNATSLARYCISIDMHVWTTLRQFHAEIRLLPSEATGAPWRMCNILQYLAVLEFHAFELLAATDHIWSCWEHFHGCQKLKHAKTTLHHLW